MYENVLKDKEIDYIDKSVCLLSDSDKCLKAMKRVVNEWTISTRVNFTNIDSNRRAWLGQAACYIEVGTPEHLTRTAWGIMDSESQNMANRIAETVIKEWETDNFYEGGLFC